MTLATLYTVIQAGVPGNSKSFKGRMACLQIYNEALNDTQLEDVQNCPVRKWSQPTRFGRSNVQCSSNNYFTII